ncbi:FadR/GntR family transcriptional regulator [Leucobacter chromiireducens]|uniref:FadR family transcriptional regulator n=1 Tax=Leucobacter chromiireducens subsp. solipictus TaxID=398235 RepID=A0ABS1SBK8_9MICO|nr:GntR family transcriptional regulator [Leucobacter chromiireducens]MBL3677885.1 FadR family transcriptional regulator [Leucobacter chromiireducens subsp. solipictus]
MQIIHIPPLRDGAKRGSEEVFSALVQAIATGQLRAGDRLPPEDQLAAQFDVAPMTLRQALAQLRKLEFVETRRGRTGGSYVRDDIADRLEHAAQNQAVTVEDLRDLTDWRRAISGEASFLAALRATSAELAQLSTYSDEYHHVYIRPAERRLADARFHLYIAELSRSSHLIAAEREIQEHLTRVLRVIPQADSSCEHDFAGHHGLVRAIEAGDPHRARSELHDHIEATFSWSIQQPSVTGAPVPAVDPPGPGIA